MSDFPLPKGAQASASWPGKAVAKAGVLFPGLALTIAVTIAAWVLQYFEIRLLGRAWLETLVLALLLGTAVRSVWTPSAGYFPGIKFSAKTLLEIAILLLGASVSAETLMHIGPLLIGGTIATVAVAIPTSYAIARALGLKKRLAMLVACGNSICGNAAIAAVAPVIGADADDIAASIAFSGVLGVIVVLTLPLVIPVLALTHPQYGVLAGLTVYAVPQVLAATAPVGPLALKIGTLVKLVRVLTLGPVILVLSLLSSRLREETDELPPHITAGDRPAPGKIAIHRLVPWFIVGFLALAGARSADLLPHLVLAPAESTTSWLMIVAMAALGLGVDVRTVAMAGGRVTTAVTASLFLIGAIGFAMIRGFGIG